MDPNAFLASLQQNGTQFTPAQLQQIQLFQQQQQQNQQQQVTPQNVDTLSSNNDQNGHNISNINPNSTSNNLSSDMNGAATFQGPPQTATHQVINAPPAPVNPNANAYTTNNAFQMALLGAAPLQQQLAALSGYAQQQPNAAQVTTDNSATQKQQQGTDNGQAQQQQQQQQIQTWNPQMLQQQFNGVNPFMAAQGLVVPTAMNVQQLQQQFLTQQFLTQQLAATGHNPAAATGNFNHLLASLLAQSGAASAMNPAVAGIPNQMFQAPTMAGFPFATAQQVPAQQHLMTTTLNNQTNSNNVKGPSNDGMKVGGEVEWTKPFAAKVKKESPFPLKLYQILGNPECQECITWNPHGRSWRILKPPVFEQVVIPLYFRHAKYASFMRQVNGWGFKRVVTGSDHNSYYHELFVRDNPQLCLQMKRIKRNDTDDAKPSKDDDGQDDDEVNHEDKASSNADNNVGNMTMAINQPALPTPTPEDLLKFAGMAGMLPVGLNTGAMVGQPNFMLNNMLPAAALLGNQSAALMNGMNPLNFVAGLPGANATPPVPPHQFQPMQQQQSQASTPTVAMSNVTTGASQQNTSTQNNANINGGLMGAFAGVDSATLAKIQEIVASGGAETLLQQLQQQHGQQQLAGGFGVINTTTNTAEGTGSTTMNTIGNNNENDTPNQDEVAIKAESEDPVENDDDEDEEDDDDDEEDDDDEGDDDDDDDDIAGV